MQKLRLLIFLGGLLSISSFAQTIQHINPPTLPKSPRYSQAVATTGGKTIYVSEMVSLDKAGLPERPASTTVQVARLFQEDFLLKIDVIAVVK